MKLSIWKVISQSGVPTNIQSVSRLGLFGHLDEGKHGR